MNVMICSNIQILIIKFKLVGIQKCLLKDDILLIASIAVFPLQTCAKLLRDFLNDTVSINQCYGTKRNFLDKSFQKSWQRMLVGLRINCWRRRYVIQAFMSFIFGFCEIWEFLLNWHVSIGCFFNSQFQFAHFEG